VRRCVKSLRDVLQYPGGVVAAIGLSVIVVGTSAGIIYIPIAGPIIGAGTTLFALGISELLKFCRSTTELDYTLDLEIFDNTLDLEIIELDIFNNLYRISALIHNSGNATVKDAKAVLTVESKPEELRNMLVGCENALPYLVNQHNPRIEGEALPWALPENPIPLPTTENYYAHITSISPHQRARLLLFDFVKDGDGYLVRFFSEYGAPKPADPAPKHYRACLNIDKDREIRAKVYVSGEGLRKPLEFCLKISKDVLDSIVNNPKEVEKLGQC